MGEGGVGGGSGVRDVHDESDADASEVLGFSGAVFQALEIAFTFFW